MQPPPPPPPPPSSPPPPPGWSAQPVGPPPAYGNVAPANVGWAPQPSITGSVDLAGFWIRFLGYFLDGILYGIVAAVFSAPGFGLIANAYNNCFSIDDEIYCPPGEPNVAKIAGGIALIAVGVVIVVVLFIRALARTGQTWGARIVGVKVVRQDNGQPIGVGKAIGRTLFTYISSSAFYLGYLWMLWDRDKQTWQDKIVSSIVIRVK